MSHPLRLDIRHYESVVAIVEAGTMTRAARTLSITQSAMSHRLAEAERRLGVALFSRGPDRRLTPTGPGWSVHQAATRALEDLRRVEDAVADAAPDVTVTVRVGVGSYECYHWYPSLLAAVHRERPDVDLDLVVTGDSAGTALADRSVDLVLAPGRPDGDHELLPAFHDELVLVCAPDHRLAAMSSIEATDLATETYLTYSAYPAPGFEYDRFVRPVGEFPRIVRIVRQTSAIVELVAAGVGVSILSRWATEPACSLGRLTQVRCGTEGLPLTWHTAYRRGDDAAEMVAERLAAHLRADLPPRASSRVARS